MNQAKFLIIMASDHISSFSGSIEAEWHRHWMMQMFLNLDHPLDLQVDERTVSAKWALVSSDQQHRISSKGGMHFTMLIEPTSSLAASLKAHHFKDGNSVAILDGLGFDAARQLCLSFLKEGNAAAYEKLLKALYRLLSIEIKDACYDQRVYSLLQKLDACDCSDHSITQFAKELYLSPSRLAHLVREETGIPLKSYIVLHKLEKAYEILLCGGASITDAAMLAGFDSPSHFAATSKSMMGMSASSILKDSEFLKVRSFARV